MVVQGSDFGFMVQDIWFMYQGSEVSNPDVGLSTLSPKP